jgi:hypothetical protein
MRTYRALVSDDLGFDEVQSCRCDITASTAPRIMIKTRNTMPTKTKTQIGTIPHTFLLATVFHFFSGGFSAATTAAVFI